MRAYTNDIYKYAPLICASYIYVFHVTGTYLHILSVRIFKKKKNVSIARFVEDKTRKGHRNAKRNPNRNHETIVLYLDSFETLKREVEW